MSGTNLAKTPINILLSMFSTKAIIKPSFPGKILKHESTITPANDPPVNINKSIKEVNSVFPRISLSFIVIVIAPGNKIAGPNGRRNRDMITAK